MTQINSRPSFFPNSSNSSTAKARNTSLSGDVNTSKTNSPERIEELNIVTGDHAKVSIPESIKDYAAIKKAVDNSAPLDNSSKVAALKQQIENGTYKVDYDALADKMLESEF